MSVAPLPEPVERCDNLSDFATTKRFRSIMEHEDNADVARMFVVGLPMNDPPPADAPEETVDLIEKARTSWETHYVDKDGDRLDIVTVEADCPEHGDERVVAFGINGLAAVVIPSTDLAPVIAYLTARMVGLPVEDVEEGE